MWILKNLKSDQTNDRRWWVWYICISLMIYSMHLYAPFTEITTFCTTKGECNSWLLNSHVYVIQSWFQSDWYIAIIELTGLIILIWGSRTCDQYISNFLSLIPILVIMIGWISFHFRVSLWFFPMFTVTGYVETEFNWNSWRTWQKKKKIKQARRLVANQGLLKFFLLFFYKNISYIFNWQSPSTNWSCQLKRSSEDVNWFKVFDLCWVSWYISVHCRLISLVLE